MLLGPQVRRPVQQHNWELFSEGEKAMAVLTFLFFLSVFLPEILATTGLR